MFMVATKQLRCNQQGAARKRSEGVIMRGGCEVGIREIGDSAICEIACFESVALTRLHERKMGDDASTLGTRFWVMRVKGPLVISSVDIFGKSDLQPF